MVVALHCSGTARLATLASRSREHGPKARGATPASAKHGGNGGGMGAMEIGRLGERKGLIAIYTP